MARACLTRPRRCTASEIFLGWPHNRLMIAAAMPPDCLFSTAETLHLSQSDSNRLSPVAPIAFTRPPSLLLLRHLRSRTGGCRPHWVVAACDGDPGVERIADAAIRKRQNANLDDPLLVDALLALVLGAKPAAPGQAAAAAADADPLTGRTATSTPVRLRALSLLARSMGAASRFPGTLQVRTSDWLWSGFDGLRVALLAHRKLPARCRPSSTASSAPTRLRSSRWPACNSPSGRSSTAPSLSSSQPAAISSPGCSRWVADP